MRHKVLDNGFIELIDHMGADKAVILAARACWRSESRDIESDKKLISHLIVKGHGTPFEHAVFTFDVKCPIFVARQWIRHRMASYDEVSLRHCIAERDYYIPEELKGDKKEQYIKSTEASFDSYKTLLESGLRREQARMLLPLNIYTQFYWTINARSLMNFLTLRLDKSAQYEIRQYAEAIFEIFKKVMPITAEAFERNILKTKHVADFKAKQT